MAEQQNLKMPTHVAIILDGNGRWAKSKGMPRNYGHVQGAKTVETICEEAYKMGISYLTVYAFSTENWNRPKDEVDALDPDIRRRIEELEESTKENDGLHFQIALNYGGRDEIRRACQKIAEKVKSGELDPLKITEEQIGDALDMGGIPDPDLLIRTCNEQRISNFLLWELAYTEFYFTPVAWPDFSKEELQKAVEAYNHRDRRYGRIEEE